MKLRLPKKLTVALTVVLLIGVSSSAKADSWAYDSATNTTAYTDNEGHTATYAGHVYTWQGKNDAFHGSVDGAWTYVTDAKGAEAESRIWGQHRRYIDDGYDFMANGGSTENAAMVSTLRFTATGTRPARFTFGPLNIAGIIVESGATDYNVWGATSARSVIIGNTSVAGRSSIAEDFTLDSNGGAITLRGTQTIAVAENKTFFMKSGNSETAVESGAAVTVTGGGTLDFAKNSRVSGTLTIAGAHVTNLGGTLNNGSSIRIEDGGVLAVQSLNNTGESSVLALKDGGKLIIGGNTNSNNGTMMVQAGATIGLSTATATFAQAFRVETVADKALTIDTKQYSRGEGGLSQAEDAAGGTLTISGAVSGSGALVKTGAGTLKLTNAANSFSGAVAIEEGTLYAKNLTISGAFSGAGDLVLDGGTNTISGDNSAFSGKITVNNAAMLTVENAISIKNLSVYQSNTQVTFNGAVTATGDARINISYENGAAGYPVTATFNQGLTYNGSTAYAIVVGANNTLTLGGSSNLNGKSLGLGPNAILNLKEGATLSLGQLQNTTGNKNNNGIINVGQRAQLTTTANKTQYITTLNLGNESTTNIQYGATTIVTLGVASGSATLKHGGNAVSTDNTVLGNGATLELFYSDQSSGAVSLGALSLSDDAESATIKTTYHGGALNIGSISGEGTLTLRAQSDSSVHSKFNIGSSTNTETQFSGTLVLDQANTTGGARTITWTLNDAKTLADADILLQRSTSGGNTVNATVALGAEQVSVKGIADKAGSYSTGGFTIGKDSSVTAATATLELTGNGTYSTAAKVGADVNIVMSGTGTQSFNGNMAQFNGSVAATAGILQLLNQTSVSVADLTITGTDAEHGAEVGVYQGATNTSAEGGISVSGTLSANAHATLNANLTMKGGSTIAVSGPNGLTMGCDVTFEGGDKMHLSSDIISGLNSLTAGSGLTLFSGVDSFNGSEANFSVSAAEFFDLTGVNRPWDFVLQYTTPAGSAEGGVVQLLMATPEPATTTLSLLALCALAARRKRK